MKGTLFIILCSVNVFCQSPIRYDSTIIPGTSIKYITPRMASAAATNDSVAGVSTSTRRPVLMSITQIKEFMALSNISGTWADTTRNNIYVQLAEKQAKITNGSITNAQLANAAVTNLSGINTGDQTIVLTGDVTGSGTGSFAAVIGSGKVTNAMLAGAIDLTTKTTGNLPFSQTGGSAAATTATTGAMTVNMTTPIITITPTGACTFNASGGAAAQRLSMVVTTSGTTSFVLTFGTNFRSTANLATGTTTAKKFCISFLCLDGTTWVETGRTAAQ